MKVSDDPMGNLTAKSAKDAKSIAVMLCDLCVLCGGAVLFEKKN